MKNNHRKKNRSRSEAISLAHKKRYLKRKEIYKIESDYVKCLIKKRILDLDNLDYGLALVSAFVLTDGWIHKNKRKKRLELGFSNRNRVLVQTFSDLVFFVFGEAPSCRNLIVKQKSVKYVASWHQNIIKKIYRFCFKKGFKSAKNILKIDNFQIVKEVIRIAFSCDGYISFQVATEKYGYSTKYYSRIRPNLAIGCKPKKLRIEWKQLLKKIGIKSKLEKDRIKVSSWAGLQKFKNLNGFLVDTFIGNDSIYFRGLDKNSIVERLLYLKDNNLQNNRSNSKDSILRNRIINFGEIYGT